jgi:hypothetical protein
MAIGDVSGQVQPDLARPGFFDFNINGLATSKQMERLIELTSMMAKRLTKDKNSEEGKAQAARIDALKEDTVETKKATQAAEGLKEATTDLSDHFDSLSRVAHGSFKGLSDLSYFLDHRSKLALGLTGFGTMLGALNGYADNLGKAMQMGVGGDIMTFAIASKTAGLRLESFTKAMSETGGAFASLGGNATDGAVSFGKLINEVRIGTEQFGNLGLSVEELSVFTAQQVKTAVSQGFKGKAAQEQVRANSVALAKDLANLSESTGKSVTELAAAANKLATDPLVATMVATTKANRDQVSKAVNSFGASIRGVFGEAGDALGMDAMKAAAAGLPLAMTEAGKNLMIASTPLYNEFTKLAQGVQQGRQVTEEDRDRLRKLAEQEVASRGEQLKTLSMLEGPAGEAAKQVLKLAEEARFYNTEEGKDRRKQLDASRKFVAERNKLEANLQQALVPVLEVLNKIDWNVFYGILNGVTSVFTTMLNVLKPITAILGAGNGFGGSLFGALLGIVSVLGIAKAAVMAFAGITGAARGVFSGGTGGVTGGIAGMFSRRANGQTASTPLWVRSADLGAAGMMRGDYRNISAYGAGRWVGKNKGMLLGGAMGLGALGIGSMLGGLNDSSGFAGFGGSIFDALGYMQLAHMAAGSKQLGGLAALARGSIGGTAGRFAGMAVKSSPYAIAGGLASGGIAGALGAGDSTGGAVGNVVGTVGGAVGGMAAGRVLGGAIGAFFGGPVGIALFSTLGGVVGQVVGDKLFGDKVKDTAASANDEIYSANMKQADDTAKLNSQVSELIDQQRAANSINVQALAYQRDTSRGIRNLPLPS